MHPAILCCLLASPLVTNAIGQEKMDGDYYLACLVGQGVIEMRHEMTADQALKSAMITCKGVLEKALAANTKKDSDWPKAVYNLAAQSLRAIEAAPRHGVRLG